MEKESIIIHLQHKMVALHFTPFDSDVDVDDLVQIHYDNLIGEILTVSALLNRVGWLKAEAQDAVRRATLDLEIEEAQGKERYRKATRYTTTDAKGNAKIKNVTKDEVDNAIVLDPEYQRVRNRLLRIEKEYDYIDSLYWAVKSKDQKLNRIADSLKPEDYEKDIVEGMVNSFMIKVHKKHLP